MMKSHYLLSLIGLLAVIVGDACAALTCKPFPAIAESKYNKTYQVINYAEGDARPLGFMKSTVIYEGSGPNPCYTSTGVVDQYIEIKFETVPTMQLCFREIETGTTICDIGRHSSCRISTQLTMTYEYYCDKGQGCAESDVNFWMRLTRGPLPENDPEGMWCSNLRNVFPESLRPLPPNFTPGPKEKAPIGLATIPGVSVLLIVSPILSALNVWQ